jgi:nucleotide-binding universal stress UspA family protein
VALRMLIPLDGSQRSEQALASAIEIAEATWAEVYLLRVVAPAPAVARDNPAFDPHAWDEGGGRTLGATFQPITTIETATQATEGEKAEAQDYLAAVAPRFTWSTVHSLVRVAEHPVDEIIKVAEECLVHLIVMPGHGRRGLARAVLSSTTEGVVHAGRFPVLLVPPRNC